MSDDIKALCAAVRKIDDLPRVNHKPVYDLVNAIASRWPAPDEIRYILLCGDFDPAKHYLNGDPRACWAAVVEYAGKNRAWLTTLLNVIEREWAPVERVYPR